MNELMRCAFDEATAEAAKLSDEPVAVVVLVFSKNGTAAPIMAIEEDAVQMVIHRLGEVVDHMVTELVGQAPDADEQFDEVAARLATHAVGDVPTH
jgi:hypothetical protein